MKKITSLILALVLTFSLVALSACGDKTTDDKKAAASDDKVITVGASATPHAEILEQIKQALADEGYDPEFGARPVKRVIHRMVLNRLSKDILAQTVDKDKPIIIDVDKDNDTLVFKN